MNAKILRMWPEKATVSDVIDLCEQIKELTLWRDRIVLEANTNPLNPIGHVIEHVAFPTQTKEGQS